MHNSIRGGTFHAPVVQADTAHVTVTARPPTIAGLPPVTSALTGRDQDLAELRALLAPDGPSTVTVTGLGGIGKTTLALAAGHALLGEGHYSAALFVDLRGYDETPVEAGQALDTLLRALGVPAEHIPPDRESRATLYRARLEQHGGGVLVIADNASAADQVRPLQPPPATRHRLLVTSRETLPGLGARLHRLGVLDAEAAVTLLDTAVRAAHPDDERITADPAAAGRIAKLCSHLPLALRLAAAHLVLDPHLCPDELAEDLADRAARLDLLDDGEVGMRIVLDRSHRRLTEPQAELFRLLVLNPGPDISTEAVAALTGTKPREVRSRLARLAGSALIEQAACGGRWYLHDLVRDYALEQLGKDPELGARRLSRLVEYYVMTAHAANRRAASPPECSDAGLFPERAAALAWLDCERANMVVLTLSLAHVGIHRGVARLSPVVVPGLIYSGRADMAIAVTEAALRAADSMGTSDVEADVWNNYGISLSLASRSEEAVEAHRRALAIARSCHDRVGETIALLNLGERLRVMGCLDEALEFLERARVLCEECDDRLCPAVAWGSTGSALRVQDRNDEASQTQEHAQGTF
ncbi:NB-ARC domain-containing protein [Kitasatospora sp. NPDC001261]|uniref:NB-ARC domain-containing protein n=1 Tax=Kitasatospora sp. NPDC001261 TaxID=3364012 RepID=UPI00368AEC37